MRLTYLEHLNTKRCLALSNIKADFGGLPHSSGPRRRRGCLRASAHSVLPFVIYNFPGVCNGVDLDSAFITTMAQRHVNIVGASI